MDAKNDWRPDDESGRCLFERNRSSGNSQRQFQMTNSMASGYFGPSSVARAACPSLAFFSCWKRPISAFESGSFPSR
ncbi:MAG: hypothetical protein DMG37_01615 [Acidobacteria bacterium]|nr:MAG: hypothetical protein DMG37_01615 [Acidobacteriota bacterium]